MKFTTVMLGTPFKRQIQIQQGESVEMELLWKNSNSTSRDMTNASVSVKVKDGRNATVYSGILADPNVLTLTAATTATWKGKYEVEVWETRATAVPPTSSAGTFALQVDL